TLLVTEKGCSYREQLAKILYKYSFSTKQMVEFLGIESLKKHLKNSHGIALLPILDKILASDTIIFASPVYWYSISAPLKACIEHWSETLQDKRYPNFKAQMAEKDFRVILVGGERALEVLKTASILASVP
ncbi:NAD(P)H-dependent oxidoreductase, partial [Staphylococcus aureus]|uniref:NAD(P)H-dependent oxidoreductase n=1 Tax=Staphylococcus aureus TaxID=1280 RepID=UPI002108BA24